jgi:hypothetical protein
VHAFGVVAVRRLEVRQLPDASLDGIGLDSVQIIQEGDVRLDGGRGLGWQVVLVESTQDGLGANNEDIVRFRRSCTTTAAGGPDPAAS